MPELAITLETTEQDRLDQAEALVRGFCGWHIAPSRTETVEVPARGGAVVTLPSLYVTAVTSVTDDETLLAVDDDYTWSASGVLTRVGRWSTKTVTVAMVHGYATPPAEVVAVVQAIAQRAIDNPHSLIRHQVGPFADTYSQAGANQALPISLLEAEKDVLRRYRIPSVG